MGKSKDHVGKYMFVWGDTVVLKELAISAVICVILTMVFYLAGRTGLLQIQSLDPALAKGYSLLVGIVGTGGRHPRQCPLSRCGMIWGP